MPDFSGFFAAVEKALFEVATWVFLIPKTLYLVLSHPSKVPEYVKSELNPREEGRTRFHGTVSPLLLFLLVALGPFLLVQLVQVPKAPIAGDTAGFVGSPSEFRADFADLPWADWMQVTWSTGRVDSDGWEWPLQHSEPRCFGGWQETSCGCARKVIADDAGPYLEPGNQDEDALDEFVELVSRGKSADEAKAIITESHGICEAEEIYDYWCSPPPGRGCDPVYDRFFALLEEGNSADEAKRIMVAEGVDVNEAQEIFDYWCSAPPGRGCYPVYDRLNELLEEEQADEEALAIVTREYGAEAVEAELSIIDAAFAELDAEGTASASDSSGLDSPERTDDFIGDVLTMHWDEPGLYRVSFKVRDMKSGELIEQSEVHEIVVKQPTGGPGRGSKDKNPDSPRGRANAQAVDTLSGAVDRAPKDSGGELWKLLNSEKTAGLALAFLMFPLVLTLATELHRNRPLTQSTIKPAFYAQCLYLSPFVVSIWIPILLWQYLPEPEDEFLFAFLFAAVIFIWLVIAEVGFVRGERSISRFRAILWLAVPVAFVLSSLVAVAFLAVQHKYAIVEMVGRIVMVLMLVPFIASGFVRLWRWITRKKVERPFHGGEW